MAEQAKAGNVAGLWLEPSLYVAAGKQSMWGRDAVALRVLPVVAPTRQDELQHE